MLRLLSIVILLLLICLPASADDKQIQEILQRIDLWVGILESRGPEYVWGGSDPDVLTYDEHKKAWRKGLDCSGSLHFIAKHSGLGYVRTTSLKMFLGAWPGYNLNDWHEARFPDLIFFTLSADRPSGHVALIRIVEGDKGLWMSHASSGENKFMKVCLKKDSKMLHKMSGVRVLDLMAGKIGWSK
ncbi:MAG: C40 family peptidase [Desulfomonile tiedjei]|nr:C40 family peptidase [Desulfomonile tiedjei]